jgi:hypothetical protein
MARRKMGKISTGAIIGIVAGGGVLLYLLMNKTATSTTVPPGTIVPGSVGPTTAAIQAQASEQNTEVTQGANTVNNLINSIFS